MKILDYRIFLLICLFWTSSGFSHPLPNTVVNLAIKSSSLEMNLSVPLQDFEIAFKSPLGGQSNLPAQFYTYFKKHIQIKDANGQAWQLRLLNYRIASAQAVFVGAYTEIQFQLQFLPNKGSDLHDFTLQYDVIMHEITNHQALLYVNSDWENGIHDERQQIGIIEYDVPTNTIYPIHISLGKGSKMKGLKSMMLLGMKHISEGTDHLLFLLVLLLTAPLIAKNRRWKSSERVRYSVLRIVKIATAFTIGHSITLVLGTFGWVIIDIKWVEVLIALSILVTAVHALTPIFPKKEIYIAAGFGLIHGLAFATVLANLHLETNPLLLSLLGFNLGIEVMQLLVIIVVMPLLLLLSRHAIYHKIRLILALFAGIASISWALERFTGNSNMISRHVVVTPLKALFFILLLACISLLYVTLTKVRSERELD